MTQGTRLPILRDEKSAPFFDGAAQGRLVIRRCATCQEALPPEAVVCTTCASTDLGWIDSAGTGSVVVWTTVHRAPNRIYADRVPYVVGLIELDEGPWLYGLLAVTEPRMGMQVHAAFPAALDGDTYPVFHEEH